MKSPLAESQRAALIEAMLPEVPFDGWSRAALRAAARRIGVPAAEALALFPDGPADFAACFSRRADGHMLDRLESLPLDQLRVPERVALAINIRLEIVEPWREAVRRALTILALPQNALQQNTVGARSNVSVAMAGKSSCSPASIVSSMRAARSSARLLRPSSRSARSAAATCSANASE